MPIPVRQPLSHMIVYPCSKIDLRAIGRFHREIMEEVNVKALIAVCEGIPHGWGDKKYYPEFLDVKEAI